MIILNGESCEKTDTLLALLSEKNYRIDRIAVEINGVIIKKADYEKTILNDCDKIEVVSFVGGG